MTDLGPTRAELLAAVIQARRQLLANGSEVHKFADEINAADKVELSALRNLPIPTPISSTRWFPPASAIRFLYHWAIAVLVLTSVVVLVGMAGFRNSVPKSNPPRV